MALRLDVKGASEKNEVVVPMYTGDLLGMQKCIPVKIKGKGLVWEGGTGQGHVYNFMEC